MTKYYGWRPQKPDHRDVPYSPPFQAMRNPPVAADVQRYEAPIYDQGNLGSCTGNAIAGMVANVRNREGLIPKTPSRLMIYYLERVIENTVSYDAGAEIRDGLKAMAQTGACFEDLWPYDITKFTQQPSAQCYAAALHDRALQYFSLDSTGSVSIPQLKACIASGYPFVFGFTVYESFESEEVAKTGVVPMPGRFENIVGGHAVMAVRYDDRYRAFKIRNSWGKDWGSSGYAFFPYEYLARNDLCSDFWTIRLIGG